MIDKLTDKQITKMAEWRDKWITIGLSTEPADRRAAENAMQKIYRCGGLHTPSRLVWCGSPLSMSLTHAILKTNSVGDSVRASVGDSVWDSVGVSVRDSVGDSVRASVRDSVWASVRDSVRASVRDSVGDSVWDSVGVSVRDSVGDSVRASVRDSVRASVRDSVGDSVWASVGDSVWASVWDSVRDSGYGQHDAGWLSFYDFFRSVGRLYKQTEKLYGLTEYAHHAGWFLPFESIVFMSERHNILRRDERGRLHCEDGPALAYPDGWAIYVWHGVRVPAVVIEDRAKTTVEQILNEKNTEVRRVMRNLYGNERFMRDAGAKECSRSDKHGARLLAIQLPGDPVAIKMVELTCPSTGHKYMERVPPEIGDCIEALAWRFRVQPAQYRPMMET